MKCLLIRSALAAGLAGALGYEPVGIAFLIVALGADATLQVDQPLQLFGEVVSLILQLR